MKLYLGDTLIKNFNNMDKNLKGLLICTALLLIVVPIWAYMMFRDHQSDEIKSVERLAEIHNAQLLTYMKLGKFSLGILLNFNEKLLKDGIRRMKL